MSKATDINLWGSHILTCFRQLDSRCCGGTIIPKRNKSECVAKMLHLSEREKGVKQ